MERDQMERRDTRWNGEGPDGTERDQKERRDLNERRDLKERRDFKERRDLKERRGIRHGCQFVYLWGSPRPPQC